MAPRVAVLGTGKMGSALAQRLAEAGHDVVLWNRTRSRAEQVGVGAVAQTPADAAAGADIVISSLTGAEAVRATYTGLSGALASADTRHFVEMSTAGPAIVAELETLISGSGSSLVDAPIIGAPTAARRGEALIIAGGADTDVEAVRPVLELFGEVRHVGALGDGARLKLVANSMLGAVMLTAAELEVAGRSVGLDAQVVFDVLRHVVPSLEARRQGLLRDHHEPPLFALRDLRKDLGLALDMYRADQVSAPVTALARELFEEAAVESADLDISAVIRRYRPGGAASG